MSTEQRRRIEQALAETITALERAERYSPDLRDVPLIAGYRKHIERLNGMLAGSVPLPGAA